MEHVTNIDVVTQCLLRDRSTDEWEHYKRVETLSVMIAESLGWEPEEIEELRIAAMFHHVDTSGIPESSLSPRVSEYLAELNRRVTDPAMERCTVPGGRVAEGASMVALADRFDRLTTKQRYRNALSDNDAIDILWYDADTPTEVEMMKAFCRIYQMTPRVRLAKAA